MPEYDIDGKLIRMDSLEDFANILRIFLRDNNVIGKLMLCLMIFEKPKLHIYTVRYARKFLSTHDVQIKNGVVSLGNIAPEKQTWRLLQIVLVIYTRIT